MVSAQAKTVSEAAGFTAQTWGVGRGGEKAGTENKAKPHPYGQQCCAHRLRQHPGSGGDLVRNLNPGKAWTAWRLGTLVGSGVVGEVRLETHRHWESVGDSDGVWGPCWADGKVS